MDCSGTWREYPGGECSRPRLGFYIFVSCLEKLKKHTSFNEALIFAGYTEDTKANEIHFGKDV
ncbi:hypothetical protein I4000191A8_17380 [Clostridia bacterium i40-0019-1A8]